MRVVRFCGGITAIQDNSILKHSAKRNSTAQNNTLRGISPHKRTTYHNMTAKDTKTKNITEYFRSLRFMHCCRNDTEQNKSIQYITKQCRFFSGRTCRIRSGIECYYNMTGQNTTGQDKT